MRKKVAIIVILVLILGGLVWLGVFFYQQSKQPLGEQDFKTAVESIESISSEGSFLATQVSVGNATEEYKKIQTESLLDELQKTQKKLSGKSSSPDLSGQVASQLLVIKSVQGNLNSLENSNDKSEVVKLQKSLDSIYQGEEDIDNNL